MEIKYIKYVALYLRKSRGDADTDLDKHKKVLTELCIQNNWKYVEYDEIGSGDSISLRPIMQQLLKEIEDGIYDAVCVVDIDRLGRGDMGDQDKIKKAFSTSDTYVVTPQQVYNLNNDDDEFVVDMKGFIARREYKQIVKRLTQGKKVGARMGMWTNGTPPFPYEYERWKDKYNEKGLVVNDEKLVIYRYIIDSVINNKNPPTKIACDLNNMGYKSPRDCAWHGTTIYRILKDETHLGKIITNKSVGDGHANKQKTSKPLQQLPQNQWVTVENCHEPVETLEEHEKILVFLSRLTKIPKRKPISDKPLTGLIKCGICNHTMCLTIRPDRNYEQLKPCWYTDEYGNKCINGGIDARVIYKYINNDILNYKKELEEKIMKFDELYNSDSIKTQIESFQIELSNKEKALSRIQDAFENGVYNLQQFKERKDKVDKDISYINSNISILEIEMKQFRKENFEEKLKLVDKFEQEIQNENLTNKEKNILYKSIIDCIIWIRKDDNITIETKFL